MNWIDPTKGYPDSTLISGVNKSAYYIAVKGKVYHKSMNMEAIHSDGLEKIDGEDWELFHVDKENETYVWGMFVEGLGAFDICVPRDQIRELTENEKTYWSNRQMVMVGSHTGKTSYGFNVGTIK